MLEAMKRASHAAITPNPVRELLTSPLTVRADLGKRGSAQRWAATYSHGGVLPKATLERDRLEIVQQPRAHYLTVYGRQRPAETPVRTAVAARFMVRMDSIAVGLRQRSGDRQENA
jgi:hypothetical protein